MLNSGLAFVFIALLCLSAFSALALEASAQESGGNVENFIANILSPTALWKFDSFANYQTDVSTPIVINGLIYVAVNGDSDARTLYCLNASTGNEVWNSLTNVFAAFDIYTVSAAYVLSGNVAQLYADSSATEGIISCLNAVDGHQLWTYTNGTGFGVPILADGVVYDEASENANSGAVYALNVSNGAVIWESPGPIRSIFDENSLIVSGGEVYAIGDDGPISAFDACTGKNVWNYTMSIQVSSFTTDGSRIYVGSETGEILALNGSNGSVVYDNQIGSPIESMITANNSVYTACSNGDIYAFDSSNGKLEWHYSTGSSVNSALSVDGYLYVSTNSGLSCLEGYNGNAVWSFKLSSAANPAYSDGIIYVGEGGPEFFSSNIQHSFYALDATTGKILWSYSFPYVEFGFAVYRGTLYIGADYVTNLSPDNIGSGAVFAVKPIISSLPLLPVTLWEATVSALRVASVVALIVVLVVVFLPRKKQKVGDRNEVA